MNDWWIVLQIPLWVCLICAVSIAFIVLITLFDVYNWSEWTMEKFVLLRSYQMAEAMFIWSSKNYTEVTDRIDENYGLNITLGSTCLGVACTVINICGNIQDYVIQDLSIFVALTIHSEAAAVNRSIQENSSREYDVKALNKVWEKCLILHELSSLTNDTFGVLWKLLHIRHLFSTTLFLLGSLKNAEFDMLNTLLALNTIKLILFYWVAVETSSHVITYN